MPAPLLSIYEGAAGLGDGPGSTVYDPNLFRFNAAQARAILAMRQPRTMADGSPTPMLNPDPEMPTAVKVGIGVGLIALLGVVYMAVR